MLDCPFCERYNKGEYVLADLNVMRFAPLNPVTPGHHLFMSVEHVDSAASKPWVTGEVFTAAAQWAQDRRMPFNLITSAGADATQSVWHLHVHYVPRRLGDGLHLPWTGQVAHE